MCLCGNEDISGRIAAAPLCLVRAGLAKSTQRLQLCCGDLDFPLYGVSVGV